jgi:hypothetical protein
VFDHHPPQLQCCVPHIAGVQLACLQGAWVRLHVCVAAGSKHVLYVRLPVISSLQLAMVAVVELVVSLIGTALAWFQTT